MSRLDEIFELLGVSNVPGTTFAEVDPTSIKIAKQHIKSLVSEIAENTITSTSDLKDFMDRVEKL